MALGLALSWRAFGNGLLLNLDLVVGDRIPVPPSQYGAGAELPRRVPFYTLLAPLSWVIPGPAVVASVLTLSVTGAVAGSARLVADVLGSVEGTPPSEGPGRTVERWSQESVLLAVGAAYGLSPLLVTRAAVGHLPLVVATALLPWAVVSLRSGPWPRALLWSVVFALTGSSGSVLGLVPLVLFTALDRVSWPKRFVRVAAVLAAQAVWLLPGVALVAGGAELPTSSWRAFRSDLETVGDGLRLVAGGGFFVQEQDVAWANRWALGLALAIVSAVALAVWTRRRSGVGDFGGWPFVLAAFFGAVLVLAPITPGLSMLWGWAMGWAPLSVIREPQKFWPLFGLWALVVGAVGLRSLPGRWAAGIAASALAGLALMAAWPGLWGANGRLVASAPPLGWQQVEANLVGEDGRLVVLPWERYGKRSLSEGRTVLGPSPWLLTEFEGVVLTSGDPGLNVGASERTEPLDQSLAEADADVRAAQPVAGPLADLGIRWVLVDGSNEVDFYRRLGAEDGVVTRVAEGQFLLFELGHISPQREIDPSLLSVVIALLGVVISGVCWVVGLSVERRRPKRVSCP